MLTFFHGWQRKMGAVTLLMACAFMVLWVRSRLVADFVKFSPVFEISHDLSSNDGEFQLTIWNKLPRKPQWRTMRIERAPDEGADAASRWPIETGWILQVTADSPQYPKRGRVVIIQCWVIVIPLTLLSAYLLLSKPRPKLNQPDDTDFPQKQPDPR